MAINAVSNTDNFARTFRAATKSDSGSDPQKWSEDLRNAVKDADTNKVKDMLAHRPSDPKAIDIQDDKGKTALHQAVVALREKSLELVKLLVEEGKIDMAVISKGWYDKFTDQTKDAKSAYQLAVQTNNEEVADYLKDKMNIEAKAAFENGDQKRLDDLIKAGADEPPAKPTWSYNPKYDDELNAAVAAFDVSDNERREVNGFAWPTVAPHIKNLFIKKLVDNGKTNFSDDDTKRIFDEVKKEFRNRLENRFSNEHTPAPGAGGGSPFDPPSDNYVSDKMNIYDGYIKDDGKHDGLKDLKAIQDDAAKEFSANANKYLGISKGEHPSEPGQGDGDAAVPDLPSHVKRDETVQQISELRKKYGLPSEDETNLFNLKTSKGVDGKEAGDATVSQRTIFALYTKYKEMLDKGEIKADDPHAKFALAIDADSMTSDGYYLIPATQEYLYRWSSGPNGGSTVLKTGKPVHLAPADMLDLIDTGKLTEYMNQAMSDKTVHEDFNTTAVEMLKETSKQDRQAIGDKLKGMFDKDHIDKYLEFISEAKKIDPTEAAFTVSRDINSLKLTDSKAAEDAEATLGAESQAFDFNKMMEDPKLISEEAKAYATTDTVETVVRQLRNGAWGNSSYSWMLGGTADQLSDILGKLSKDTPTAASLWDAMYDMAKNGTSADSALGKVKNGAKLTGMGVGGLLGKLQQHGVFYSLFGLMAPLAAAYNLVDAKQSGGDFFSTIEGRVSFARAWMTFMAGGTSYVRSSNWLFNKLSGGKGNWAATLGFKHSAPEIFGIGMEAATKPATELGDAVAVIGNQGLSPTVSEVFELTELTDGGRRAAGSVQGGGQIAADMGTAFERRAAAQGINAGVARTMWNKIGWAVFKGGTVIGGFGSALGSTVMTGLSLDKALKEHGPGSPESIQAGLNVGYSAAWLAGSVGEVASLTGIAALAPLGALTVPMFFVGGILAGAAITYQFIQERNKKHAAVNAQADYFTDLQKAGLTYGDVLDKLEFLRYYTYKYGQRDAPGDKSIFQFNKDEWERFAKWLAQYRQHATAWDGMDQGATHEKP